MKALKILSLLFLTLLIVTCKRDDDLIDGNNGSSITIGTQEWMVEN